MCVCVCVCVCVCDEELLIDRYEQPEIDMHK